MQQEGTFWGKQEGLSKKDVLTSPEEMRQIQRDYPAGQGLSQTQVPGLGGVFRAPRRAQPSGSQQERGELGTRGNLYSMKVGGSWPEHGAYRNQLFCLQLQGQRGAGLFLAFQHLAEQRPALCVGSGVCRGTQGAPAQAKEGVEQTDLFCGAPSREEIVLSPVFPQPYSPSPQNQQQKESCQRLGEANRCGVTTLGS